jgi:DNA-binding beta-propeller fold protein YncE
MAAGSRPHHVHASPGRDLVAFGLYGTDKVAVVDTRTDMLLGPWDTNPDPTATSGRAHAGVFSTDGTTLYVASDASNEVVALEPRTGRVIWRMPAVGAHELVVAPDGRTAYLSRRTANVLSEVDLERRTYKDVATLGLPDTLRFATLQRRLTVGLRTSPAQLAVVNPLTFDVDLVNIGPVTDTGTIAGHQWTSSDGRYTFAAFEGGSNPGVAVIDHRRSENRVVRTLAYPGRPHGVDLAPAVDLELQTEDE